MLKQNNYHLNHSGFLKQDIGIFILLAALFTGILATVLAPQERKLEFVILLLLSYMAMLFAAYGMALIAVVCAGLQIIIYAVYKLFAWYAYGTSILTLEFAWLIYPLLLTGAMNLFISRTLILENKIELLRGQAAKLVLIDSLTGLYNLKSLYLDLRGQIALAARRDMDITLMIMALRYEAELSRLLGRSNMDLLKQKIAMNVQDTLRVEDRIYAIDEKGSLAILLNCKGREAVIVKNRLLKKLTAADALPELIKDKSIKVDFRFGYLQYSHELYGNDVIGFKMKVEGELQYDV